MFCQASTRKPTRPSLVPKSQQNSLPRAQKPMEPFPSCQKPMEPLTPPSTVSAGKGSQKYWNWTDRDLDSYCLLVDIMKYISMYYYRQEEYNLLFSDEELRKIMYEMNVYKNHIIAYEKLRILTKKLGRDMALQIMKSDLGVVLNYDMLQEKKAIMNKNISDILCYKAMDLARYRISTLSLSRSFNYSNLEPCIRQMVLENPNIYWVDYNVVSQMVEDSMKFRMNKVIRSIKPYVACIDDDSDDNDDYDDYEPYYPSEEEED